MSTKLEALKKRHAELQKQIQEESQAFFKEESKAIFDKFPEVKEFSWQQYTVYFNDGDTCSFHVRDYTARINGEEEYNGEYDNAGESKAKAEKFDEAMEAVKELINSIEEDTMLTMFGDHAQVIVRRDGIEIEEYADHD